MIEAEKERKQFWSQIPFILDPGKKILEKIAKKFKKVKTSFRHYLSPQQDDIGREREKKLFVLNSVHTRLREENSKKN